MSGLPLHNVQENATLSKEIQMSTHQENTEGEMKIYDDLVVCKGNDETPMMQDGNASDL